MKKKLFNTTPFYFVTGVGAAICGFTMESLGLSLGLSVMGMTILFAIDYVGGKLAEQLPSQQSVV